MSSAETGGQWSALAVPLPNGATIVTTFLAGGQGQYTAVGNFTGCDHRAGWTLRP